MDIFLEKTGTNYEPEIQSTPFIDFQLDKWMSNEYFAKKQIPTNALFTKIVFIEKLKNFFVTNLDIPLLVYGLPGCGKLTSLIAMMPYCPAYYPSIQDINDSRRIGNIRFMKSLHERDFPKLLVYENLYVLNISVLNNNSEITDYLKQTYKIAKSRSIDISKKIIIITHIELCNTEAQRYITFMLDKINANTSYIFTTTKVNQLDKKIRTFCAPITYEYLDEVEFNTIFKNNYLATGVLDKRLMSISHLKRYWEIYYNNHYNIGNTIAQIKYLINSPDITLEKLKLDENRNSLLDNIAANFIKKKLKLTTLTSALEIRKFIYTLLSIGIDLQTFISHVIKQLLSSKINDKTKSLIIEKAGNMSACLPMINKELIAVETFMYQLVYTIYSCGQEIPK
jgi:hypothetical protein